MTESYNYGMLAKINARKDSPLFYLDVLIWEYKSIISNFQEHV